MRFALDERASRFSIQGILVPFFEKVNLTADANLLSSCHVFYYPRLNVFRYGVRYPSLSIMIAVAFYTIFKE